MSTEKRLDKAARREGRRAEKRGKRRGEETRFAAMRVLLLRAFGGQGMPPWGMR